jgi:hypothetical protein
MKCTSPLSAYLAEGGGLTFHPLARHGDAREIKIPCRQCLSCRLNRASEWQTRLIHEGKRHSSKIFLTLTYDNEHLPEFGSLQTRHLQLFIKRLRKAIAPLKIRYYACGEYGDTTRRAHYHAIIYGWEPSDGSLHSVSHTGDRLYVSRLLSQLWTFGNHLFSPADEGTMGYVARYTLKKQTGQTGKDIYKHVDDETGELTPIKPPFAVMSLRPMIGADHLDKFQDDYFRLGSTIINGVRKPLPIAYVRKLKKIRPDWHVDFVDSGAEFAFQHKDDLTYQRLAVADEVLKAKTQSLKRKL